MLSLYLSLSLLSLPSNSPLSAFGDSNKSLLFAFNNKFVISCNSKPFERRRRLQKERAVKMQWRVFFQELNFNCILFAVACFFPSSIWLNPPGSLAGLPDRVAMINMCTEFCLSSQEISSFGATG
jgi:hypothetical protein